jgi:pyruvate-formate lyase-activating enzyme
MQHPLLVVSDSNGTIFEVPGLLMAGHSLRSPRLPDAQSLVALPKSSVLFTLPGRAPTGYDPVHKKFVTIREYAGRPVYATAAFMPPGYIRTLHSAYEELPAAPRLPLYCYAAVGWAHGRFYAAGSLIDRQRRHSLTDSETAAVCTRAGTLLKRYPRNRLIDHLVNNCALKYKCPNACNLVLGRWECPIPVSSACNAGCFGCISKQAPHSGFPSSQHRIDFVPTVQEIVEYVVPHLKTAQRPIASFGQGCEGEPLLQAALVEEAIKEIRARTKRGVLNVNTNGSRPADVERLCRAGIDSLRISINSAQPEYYGRYYRPRGYAFDHVRESMALAGKRGVWVSINYLTFPGFTDHPSEIRALKELVRTTKLNMIQTRNLNVDPRWHGKVAGLHELQGEPIGIVKWIDETRRRFPEVNVGYFNPVAELVRSKGRRTDGQ